MEDEEGRCVERKCMARYVSFRNDCGREDTPCVRPERIMRAEQSRQLPALEEPQPSAFGPLNVWQHAVWRYKLDLEPVFRQSRKGCTSLCTPPSAFRTLKALASPRCVDNPRTRSGSLLRAPGERRAALMYACPLSIKYRLQGIGHEIESSISSRTDVGFF